MAFELDGLIEVILYVDDMAAQVAFYRDTLGLDIAHPRNADDYAELDWVAFDTGECALALHSGGEPARADGSPEFVFQVADIEEARDALRDRGVDVGEVREPIPGVRVCGATDPEGNPFSVESRDTD